MRYYHAIPETIGRSEGYKTTVFGFTTGTGRTGSKIGEDALCGLVLKSRGDMSEYEGKEYKRQYIQHR